MSQIKTYEDCEQLANNSLLELESEYQIYLEVGTRGEIMTILNKFDFDVSDFLGAQ